MSIKTKIKNDLWRWNYVLPFVKKHQFDEKGKIDIIKHVIKTYFMIHPVKSKEHTVGYDIKEILKSMCITISKNSRFIYFIDVNKTIAIPGNIISNFTVDYDKVIHGTFNDIATYAVGDGNDEYGLEAKAVVEGINILKDRIIEAIVLSNSSSDIKEKQLFYFKRMLTFPAIHFEEAIQRILFFNQILWQTRHRLNGLGRLDKILFDLYEQDKKDNLLDYDQASEIVFDFLYELSKYPSYKSDALEGDIGQIIVLGGNEPDGSYYSNDLTYIFLKQQKILGKPDPKILLRVGKNTPNELLVLSIECLKGKTGSPLFSNDEIVIPALLSMGISEMDAYSYCTSACWEPYIVGKSFDQNNIAVFDYFKALDQTLEQEYDSYEELVQRYIEINSANFKKFLEGLDEFKWAEDPLVSIFSDGCSSKRTDISKGATKYNNYGITTVAMSNVIDSLFNIKFLVYDEKKYTFKKINEARLKNFLDTPWLYDELKLMKKSYGHDEKEVIELVNKITDSLSIVVTNYHNKFGGTVKFGLSSPGYNILSKKTMADFSGRKKGDPYNTHISCIDAPYTELVHFASQLKCKHQRFNGNVLDFFVSPSFIEKNFEAFLKFLKGSIKQGFFQMQMNIMDSKTLIEAKKCPEKYTGLIVRVWGFSAYFNDLPESYKDLLINRAIAAEMEE